MRRMIDRYPLLTEVLRDSTVAQSVRAVVESVNLTDTDFRNHFRRRRINAPALIEGVISPEAVADWLADLQDAASVALDGIPDLRLAYETTRAGALSDNGRREARTVYAAPNGVESVPQHVTGAEVMDVTGEYSEGMEHLEKLGEIRTFKDLILSRFETCFLGVLN